MIIHTCMYFPPVTFKKYNFLKWIYNVTIYDTKRVWNIFLRINKTMRSPRPVLSFYLDKTIWWFSSIISKEVQQRGHILIWKILSHYICCYFYIVGNIIRLWMENGVVYWKLNFVYLDFYVGGKWITPLFYYLK